MYHRKASKQNYVTVGFSFTLHRLPLGRIAPCTEKDNLYGRTDREKSTVFAGNRSPVFKSVVTHSTLHDLMIEKYPQCIKVKIK